MLKRVYAIRDILETIVSIMHVMVSDLTMMKFALVMVSAPLQILVFVRMDIPTPIAVHPYVLDYRAQIH